MTEGIVAGKSFRLVSKINTELNFSGGLFLQSWYNKELAGIDKTRALHDTAKNLVQHTGQKLKLKVRLISS